MIDTAPGAGIWAQSVDPVGETVYALGRIDHSSPVRATAPDQLHRIVMPDALSPQALAGPTLYPWSVGGTVVELQELLRGHGYKLKVDGDFGSRTEDALKHYQRKWGLRIDGVVGPETWKSLKERIGLGQRILRLGSTGFDVYELQGLLQVNGLPVKRHGVFDEQTQRAVQEFQRTHKLDVTGVVETLTLALICNRPQ